MSKSAGTGIRRLIAALVNSAKGFSWLVRNEAAFQQELLLLLAGVAALFVVDTSDLEKIVLLFSLVFILIVEILNTAIEATIDRIGDEYHQLSGLAKDLGSLAVLLSLVFGAITWAVILL